MCTCYKETTDITREEFYLRNVFKFFFLSLLIAITPTFNCMLLETLSVLRFP